MKYVLMLNDVPYGIHSFTDLSAKFDEVRKLERVEIQLFQVVGELTGFSAFLCRIFASTCEIEGKIASVLINGKLAYLSFLEDNENAKDMCAITSAHIDDGETEQMFFLGGQEPYSVPAHQCIPREDALNALIYFYQHGERPENFQWREE